LGFADYGLQAPLFPPFARRPLPRRRLSDVTHRSCG